MSPRTRGDDSPLGPRPPAPGRFSAVFLAVVIHAAFFGLIVFGVTWQSRPAAPLQAEIWAELPPAPKPAARPRDPEPPPAEPPRPPDPPKVEPPRPEPPKPVVKPEPPRPDPAIAEKLEREKREREKRERREKLDQEKKLKAEREKQDSLEKQKQDDAKKKREDDKRRLEADRARLEADKAREAASAQKKTEFDGFVEKIRQRIKSKANVPDTVKGNPRVQVRIKILPGGDVLEVTVVRSSGNPAYDAAIERAIRSAQPLPVPAPTSELFPQFRDLILNIDHDR